MRILHLFASRILSGPAQNIILLAQTQREFGHIVSIACDRLTQEINSEEKILPELKKLDLLEKQFLYISPKSYPWHVAHDLYFLRQLKVDVIHCHASHDHFLAYFSNNARALIVRSIHTPRSIRWSMPKANGYTVYSAQSAQSLKRKPVHKLPSLVDDCFTPAKNRLELKEKLDIKSDPTIMMVSTFKASRHHELALLAFQKIKIEKPQAKLILLGDGKTKNDIEKKVTEYHLTDSVIFVGYQKKENLVRYLQAADDLWILGLGNDFSARAAKQAKACNVRVFAVSEGALSEYADVIVKLKVDSIVSATLSHESKNIKLLANKNITQDILDFYSEIKKSSF